MISHEDEQAAIRYLLRRFQAPTENHKMLLVDAVKKILQAAGTQMYVHDIEREIIEKRYRPEITTHTVFVVLNRLARCGEVIQEQDEQLRPVFRLATDAAERVRARAWFARQTRHRRRR